ncbi:RNA 2',3'-cyclic phosphodiesterase [Patescibacteria group bacterium]|nr:RNA 2',3'-cyclic phosphodiesterase [Patescibacteria group bacterium]
MENKRLFISLPLDPVLAKDISKKIQNLNLPGDKIKFIPEEQLHLTLKFLGDTPLQNIPALIDVLENIETNFEFLELEIEKTIIFNERQPKILAISLKENENLTRLYQEIEERLFDAGLAHKEIRNFRPHVTVARVKKSADFSEFEDFLSWQIQKSFNCSHFDLQESSLSRLGPEYTVLQSFNL